MNGKWVYRSAIILKWKVLLNIWLLFFGLFLPWTKIEVINGATEYKKIAVKSQQTDSCPLFLKAEKVIVIPL